MTHSSTISIPSSRVIKWMDVIRNSSGEEQRRILESFWESQLTSKGWLINTIRTLDIRPNKDVYVFGGWYGILASLIKDTFPLVNVFSVDIDPTCENVGKLLDQRVNFVTGDMKDFVFDDPNSVGLIINTSTEHIPQSTFDEWIDNVPDDVLIVLQGNNFFECKEHIRCVNSLEEFVSVSKIKNIIYEGTLDCKEFTRFMIIGYKNAN